MNPHKGIQVGTKSIGPGFPTFVIAEIGSNHGQDLQLAFDTIDAAVDCGADAVKFQSIDVDQLYLAPNPETRALHQIIDLADSWHIELKQHCDRREVIFFSSPTYMDAVDLLVELNVELFKLASAQVGTFPQLVEKVANTGKPTLLSTGLVTYGELTRAIKLFERSSNPNFCIMHCNSVYPTPPSRVHLGRMDVYRQMFNCPVGYSDHTDGIAIAVAAVAKGASVIEKHFILERGIVNAPDEPFSIDPKEFTHLVNSIRQVEQANQSAPRTELELEESSFKDAIRYRAVLRVDVSEGQELTMSKLRFLRHHEGIDALLLGELLDRKIVTRRDLKSGELLKLTDIQFMELR